MPEMPETRPLSFACVYAYFRTKKMTRQETPIKRMTHFDNLPDELLLLICSYLTPAHVLNVFLGYNERVFRCVFDYRTNLDLTKCSYTDYQYIVSQLCHYSSLRPSTLTVSNAMIPSQINLFLNACVSYLTAHMSTDSSCSTARNNA